MFVFAQISRDLKILLTSKKIVAPRAKKILVWVQTQFTKMVVTSTLGVEASHGHDIAADIDGGAAQPVVEMRFQKYVFVCVSVCEKISLTKCRGRSSKCSRITIVTTFMLLFVISRIPCRRHLSSTRIPLSENIM